MNNCERCSTEITPDNRSEDETLCGNCYEESAEEYASWLLLRAED